MKKSIVAGLVLLAVIVMVSPGLVGRLAEKSMDDSLNWAASESGQVTVTAERFDRGWFSSEGQHRITLREGDFLTLLQSLSDPADADEVPALVINTHLDHGLVPFSSVAREGGSLVPGLGSAISTMRLEFADGTVIDVPGTIFSRIGLNGELTSRYALPAGSQSIEDARFDWSDTEVEITTDPISGSIDFSGEIGSVSISEASALFSFAGMTFSGQQRPTPQGIYVGDLSAEIGEVRAADSGTDLGRLESLSLRANTRLVGDRIDGTTELAFVIPDVPEFGTVSTAGRARLTGADAAALARVQRALEHAGQGADPTLALSQVEGDVATILARGVSLEVERFDVTLPQGTVNLTMRFVTTEDGAAGTDLVSLMLGSEAALDLIVPATFMDEIMVINPEAAALVGMGYLKRNGDVYEMALRYKKKLATINGAPLPIPFGAF